MCDDGRSFDSAGLTVTFPVVPYPNQIEYCHKVIQCLIEAKNGLLESPTGTGKTLALLCASLAWQRRKEEGKLKSKILFTSRTHGQLAQAIQQLRRLPSPPEAVALGSRDALCINDKVKSKTTLTEKNQMCNMLVKSKSCEFYNNYKRNEEGASSAMKNSDLEETREVMDIEDLVKAGGKKRVCPYYKSRDLASSSEMVFLPYNYILDPSVRQTLPVDFNDTFVMIDEAHNISSVCEESSSMAFTSQDVALALKDLDVILGLMAKSEEQSELEAQLPDDLALEDVALLKEFVMSFETALKRAVDEGDFKVGQSYPGLHLVETLQKHGVESTRVAWMVELSKQIVDLLGIFNSMGAKDLGKGMTTLLRILKTLFLDAKTSNAMLKTDFVLFVSQTRSNSPLQLNLWCFNAGLAIRSLLEKGTRSIVLTSGTLKPMQATEQELNVPFPIQFEGKHVIDKSQVLSRVVGKGTDDVTLLSTYKNRTNPEYLKSLGSTIAELLRKIPNGVLIFFPSYSVLNSCVEFWKETSVWSRLCQVKPMFVEPREKSSFPTVLEQFTKLSESESGACFAAVCRGKVSEGIDFSNKMARGVIVTGIPFPNLNDDRVRLKREHIDKDERTSTKGSDWYMMQAYKAVNQAIGRAIRSKNDFGAIFFLDSRFKETRFQNNLPDWVKEQTKQDTLKAAVEDAEKFFKTQKASSSFVVPTSAAPKRTQRPKDASTTKAFEPAAKKRIVLKGSVVDNVLKYKASNVVLQLKQKLSKPDMLVFKAGIANYKQTDDISTFLKEITKLPLSRQEVWNLIKEFIKEKDLKTFQAFVNEVEESK